MDHYYVNQPDYFILSDIRNCLVSNRLDEALTKIKTVDLNGYVRSTKHGSWVPLIYFACLSDKNAQIVQYLIKNGADPKKRPDDPERPEPLIFHCHAMYLQFLVQKGCTYYKDLHLDIVKRLYCGDHKRLQSLVKLGLITNEHIRTTLHKETNIMQTCLQTLVKYIVYIYGHNNEKIKQGSYNIKDETNKVINQYIDTCAYIMMFTEPKDIITKDCITYTAYHYLHEFLVLFKERLEITQNIEVPYHTQMDQLTVAITRPLLNDGRYYQTCQILGLCPSKELTAKIDTY